MALIGFAPARQPQPSATRIVKALCSLWRSGKAAQKDVRLDPDPHTLRDCGLGDHRPEDAYYRRFTERCLR